MGSWACTLGPQLLWKVRDLWRRGACLEDEHELLKVTLAPQSGSELPAPYVTKMSPSVASSSWSTVIMPSWPGWMDIPETMSQNEPLYPQAVCHGTKKMGQK